VIVSIHASRAGRDRPCSYSNSRLRGFNPRVPCGTRPGGTDGLHREKSFNPRVPCGTRQSAVFAYRLAAEFQSTRPVRDATRAFTPDKTARFEFQSTRPVRDATLRHAIKNWDDIVSIHASRAGRDARAFPTGWPKTVFQSTRPVRDATRVRAAAAPTVRFQSTRPVRDATYRGVAGLAKILFQSTRPVRDATGPDGAHRVRPGCFNPRVPCGTRRGLACLSRPRVRFNPRVPCGTRLIYIA